MKFQPLKVQSFDSSVDQIHFFSSLSCLEKEAKHNETSLHDGIIPISNFQEIVWVLYTFSPTFYLLKNNTTPFYR